MDPTTQLVHAVQEMCSGSSVWQLLNLLVGVGAVTTAITIGRAYLRLRGF